MLSRFAKALLVTTSFAPVLLTYAFVLFLEGAAVWKIAILITITVVFSLLCINILYASKRQLEQVSFPIQSIKTADGEVVGFLVAYLLPFASFASSKINTSVLVFVMILFFLLIWSTNAYHINPLLSLFGYNFYEVSTVQNITFLLITRRDLRSTKSIGYVVQLTDYMVLDIEKED